MANRYMDKYSLEYYHKLISSGLVEYIEGTQTSATNAWTGVSTSPALFTGKVIIYHLPYNGTSTAATLNLTLSTGETTGAKAVQNEGVGSITTQYAAGSDIFMVYTGTDWKCAATDKTLQEQIDHLNNDITSIVESEINDVAASTIAAWMAANLDPSGSTVIDKTLSIEGAAADAAAVGVLKEDLDAEIELGSVEYNPYTSAYWRKGYINPTNGNSATGLAYSISLNEYAFLLPSEGVTRLEAKQGYYFHVYAYQLDGTYVGCWDGSVWGKTWSSWKHLTAFNLLQYPNYKFRVDLNREDEQEASTSEYTNLIIYYARFGESGVRVEFTQDNLANDTTKVSGYLGTSGEIIAAIEQTTRETTTDYIPVTSGDVYTYSMYCDKSVSYWFRICFYNADKTYISRYDDNAIYVAKEWHNFAVKTLQLTTPPNARYTRITQRHGFCTVTKGVTEWEYMVSPIDIRRHWSLRPKQEYFVRTVNHRGYGRVAPENTAPAFELSADLGFWGVENDIRFTSDGVPVLLHDETINRTGRNADGTEIAQTINIRDITYAEALTYDFGIWMGEQYAGTKIMTFEEFVSLCRKKSLHMYNEIKAGTQAQVNALVNLVKRYGMQKHCTWISFSSTYLDYVTTIEQKSRVGLIVSSVTADTITTLNALKTGENDVFVDVDVNNTPTESIIEQLISNNIELEMYTLNFVSVINNADHYVTGITSDWCIAGDVLYNNVNNIMVFD